MSSTLRQFPDRYIDFLAVLPESKEGEESQPFDGFKEHNCADTMTP